MSELSLYWDGDEGAEDIRRYTAGGFHPVRLGDVLSSHDQITVTEPPSESSPSRHYRILYKLGHGSFATVWLAETLHQPSQHYVALKICVADADPKHELDIFNHISCQNVEMVNVVQLRDKFSLEGPNGVHTVLVHDVLGCLLSVARSPHGRKYARMLCRQITQGIAALHHHGIVHGDLHTRNIGISLPTLNELHPQEITDHFFQPDCSIVLPKKPPKHPEALPPYLIPHGISVIEYFKRNDPAFFGDPPRAEIMDFGSAIIVGKQTRPFCTRAGVCAPELMFARVAQSARPPPTKESDIWSLACTIFEVLAGDSMFRAASPKDGTLGAIARLCGEVPQEWKSYWESREKLSSLTISQETADAEWHRRSDYFWRRTEGRPTDAEIEQILGLLRSMLKIDPACRPSAEDVLRHPWFTDDHDGGPFG